MVLVGGVIKESGRCRRWWWGCGAEMHYAPCTVQRSVVWALSRTDPFAFRLSFFNWIPKKKGSHFLRNSRPFTYGFLNAAVQAGFDCILKTDPSLSLKITTCLTETVFVISRSKYDDIYTHAREGQISVSVNLIWCMGNGFLSFFIKLEFNLWQRLVA